MPRRPAPDPATAHLPALAAHLQHMRMRDLAPTTIRDREKAIGRLVAHLARSRTPLFDATPDQLVAYVAGMPRNTAHSRHVEICRLSVFHAWAHLHDWTDRPNPWDKVPKPRLTRGLPRPMSEADLQVALDAAQPRMRLWLTLAAYTGLRAGEIAVLDRADVLDTLPVPAVIAHGKGRKDRVVPLNQRSLLELRSYGMPARGPLFPRLDGGPGPTSNKRVSHLANEYLHGLGITHSLHSLRHRFATLTYQSSQDLLVVASLLGHDSVRTTQVYAAFSDVRAVEAVRSLDGPRAAVPTGE